MGTAALRGRAPAQPATAWTTCAFSWKSRLAANATGEIVSAAGTGVRQFCLLSHGALCFHAAPLADIGHIDEAIGAGNGFAVHGRHSAATSRTFRPWFSAEPDHAVVVASLP